MGAVSDFLGSGVRGSGTEGEMTYRSRCRRRGSGCRWWRGRRRGSRDHGYVEDEELAFSLSRIEAPFRCFVWSLLGWCGIGQGESGKDVPDLESQARDKRGRGIGVVGAVVPFAKHPLQRR